MEPESPPSEKKTHSRGRLSRYMRFPVISWKDLAETLGPALLLSIVAIVLAVHYMRPAPPHTLVIASGPAGSSFESTAQKYAKLLAKSGITLKIVNTQGSVENMTLMTRPSSKVDVALAQAGISASDQDADTSHLVSLGSMFFQPMLIFYRAPKPILKLSDLKGRRIAVGPDGSGTRALALALLKANEIEPGGPTQLLPLEGQDAANALLHDEVDAVFLTGDSAAPAAIREMLHAESIRFFDFPQADAYVRRFPYLSKLEVPAGAFDLGENLPAEAVSMVAPTVELLAHDDLHPALSDLLIEAAYQVHGRASLLQSAGQFPNPATHAYPLGAEAARYYKSGNRSFLYRYLPFWLATLADRAVVLVLPMLVVVIPVLKFVPQLYNWRIRSRIQRRYVELMALERQALGEMTEQRREGLLHRLDSIEKAAISRRIPGSHADQLYQLRENIGIVREFLTRSTPSGQLEPPAAK